MPHRLLHKLTIDPTLQALLPPLSSSEQAGLEADILKNGVLSPIITWNNVIVDGHHRYAICQKHDLTFEVKEMAFDSMDAAMLWAWQHQESRRNLTPYQRAEIALKFKDRIQLKAKERQCCGQGGVLLSTTSDEATDTKKELAKIAGIGRDTMFKAEFLEGHANDTTKQKLRKGETTINAEYKRLKKDFQRRPAPSLSNADADDPVSRRPALPESSRAAVATSRRLDAIQNRRAHQIS